MTAQPPVTTAAVLGAGIMGHGIALEFALHGLETRLYSRSQESLARAREQIASSLERLVSLGHTTPGDAVAAPRRIRFTTDLAEAVSDAGVVVESVYEDLGLKQRLFREVDALALPEAILASNTSAFMPSRLADLADRPERILVAHYINPPYLVPLVEIVPGPRTSPDAVAGMAGFLEGIGKRPIVLKREVPGFVASRIQAAVLREALWLVENGVATPADVDASLSAALGRRWAVAGVFEVLELPGWELLNTIATGLFPHLSNAADAPLLQDRVDRGETGVKAGKGFYEWTPESADELRRRIATALVEIERLGRTI